MSSNHYIPVLKKFGNNNVVALLWFTASEKVFLKTNGYTSFQEKSKKLKRIHRFSTRKNNICYIFEESIWKKKFLSITIATRHFFVWSSTGYCFTLTG